MIRGVEQLEAHVAHNHEVASSSLVPAILDYNKFPFEKAFIVGWVLSFLQNLEYDKRKKGEVCIWEKRMKKLKPEQTLLRQQL